VRLETEKGEALSNPDSRAVEAALRSLDGYENTFALLDLERGDNDFLQTMGGPDLFDVEYREAGQHFRCRDVPLETIIALFHSYRRGSDWWRSALAWQDVTSEFQ
jgi:hypothetical protein